MKCVPGDIAANPVERSPAGNDEYNALRAGGSLSEHELVPSSREATGYLSPFHLTWDTLDLFAETDSRRWLIYLQCGCAK